MIIEFAFACVIVFAVALVQVTRHSLRASGQALGVLQIGAASVCAALVPALTVYSLHFHTAWALGVAPDSPSARLVVEHGLAVAFGSACALLAVAAIAYLVAARALLAGQRTLMLSPIGLAVVLVLAALLRGSVGGRFSGEDPPPALLATVVVLLFLGAALLGASRIDSSSRS